MPSLWNQCLNYLQRQMPTHEFNTWIRPLQAKEETDKLYLFAPNQYVINKIKEHYAVFITQFLHDFQPQQPPQLILREGRLSQSQQNVQAPQTPVLSPANQTRLDSALNFNNFVLGQSNEMASRAAKQFVNQSHYNPLFIYGGVGLGKTHLMQAIGNQLLAEQNQKKITYVRAERFVDEMVRALREKKMENFKQYYRSLNLLLIDDIQFFAYKKYSQEELFHTFNTLFESNNKVVLTCNCLPNDINGLEERLQSRFGWGLSVNIAPPTLDMRIEILKAKAKNANIFLPYEVYYYMAEHIQSNVRTLEGAFNRLCSTVQMTGAEVTLKNAQEILKDLCSQPKQLLTLKIIQEQVADYYRIPVDTLKSNQRQRRIVRPRQIAMSLSKKLTNFSLPEIGQAFGGRDHSTVLYSCKTIDKLMRADDSLQKDYQQLWERLNGN